MTKAFVTRFLAAKAIFGQFPPSERAFRQVRVFFAKWMCFSPSEGVFHQVREFNTEEWAFTDKWVRELYTSCKRNVLCAPYLPKCLFITERGEKDRNVSFLFYQFHKLCQLLRVLCVTWAIWWCHVGLLGAVLIKIARVHKYPYINMEVSFWYFGSLINWSLCPFYLIFV